MFRSPDRRALAFLALLLAVLYADILFFGRGLYLQDLTSYHLPMKWIVRDVVAHGEFPFWNRFYSGGQPLAANPAYEVFYPPQWLIWLPSFALGFQLHILVHFLIAALGMYLLLRGLGTGALAATFGASVLVLSGPFLSLSTRLPLLFSLSWMPLLLHLVRKALIDCSRRPLMLAAAVASLQFILGEPTVAMQTWILIAGLLLWRAAATGLASLRGDGSRVGALFVLAALIAAVQLLPAIDHARDSVRSEAFPFEVVSNWSLPPVRIAEMVVPSLFRHVADERGNAAITSIYPFRSEPFLGEIYIGVLIVLLAAAGLATGSPGSGAVAAALITSILLAAGDHTPLLRLLYGAHLVRAIRYPEKFVLMGAFALIVWAAIILDRILSGERRLARTGFTLALIWAIVSVLIALVTSPGVALATKAHFSWNALRALLAMALLASARRKVLRPAWGFAVLALSLFDLWAATRFLVPRMPSSYFQVPSLAATVSADARGHRIYPQAYWQSWDREPDAHSWFAGRPEPIYWWMVRNSMSEHLPARWGYEIVLEDDVDRTSLLNTDAFREALKQARQSHLAGAEEPFLKVSNVGVRLTLRPIEATNPVVSAATSAVEAVPTTPYPRYVFADTVEHAATVGEFRGKLDLQRGLGNVAFADLEAFVPAAGVVTSVVESANAARIAVRAAGRAFLVMSVTGHKGWSATLDGAPIDLIPTNIAYQGAIIPPGTHILEMRYRNRWVSIGAVISLFALAGTAFVALASRAGARRESVG